MHGNLDLRDITLGQGHDIQLVHGQQQCEVLSKSFLPMKSYTLDKNFGYMFTTFSLLIQIQNFSSHRVQQLTSKY